MEKSKKEQIREYFANITETLPKEIDDQIKKAGGEDMLLLRIDILHWVYFSREEPFRDEARRFLRNSGDDGADSGVGACQKTCMPADIWPAENVCEGETE